MTINDSANPFTIRSPEDIDAAEALELFVDVFTDFHKVRDRGHTMLNGPRGCGKSMMFRFLEPDCQQLRYKKQLKQIEFFGVLVSIKNTTLNLTEFHRLQDTNANVILNEHFLTMYVTTKVFASLQRASVPDTEANRRAISAFRQQTFLPALRVAGMQNTIEVAGPEMGVNDLLKALHDACDELYREMLTYVRRLAFMSPVESPYSGPLCGYVDFLFPMLREVKQLPFMPHGPIYLLIDDADYLNVVQTKILNSWLSTRTSATVSIKVSTQLKYRTFQTVGGMQVDAPHDYSEVNISDLYTSSKSRYLHRVTEIVERRLRLYGIAKTPSEFFPPNGKQESRIATIATQLREAWKESGKGFRPGDDAHRYARPTYIASLKGTRKAGRAYSYAGFDQLVHISSGLVRYFLEAAALMYNAEKARSQAGAVTHISSNIQNEVIRDEAERLMMTEFEKIFEEEQSYADDAIHRLRLADGKIRLHNLIRVLGGIFHQKLISEDAERRVFSVAFSDRPPQELLELFKLGIQFGYFHRSTIGNKDGTGRTPLYVLTRRLAPHFTLDPTGFAGYLFVTSPPILEGIQDPDPFLRNVKDRGVMQAFEEGQLMLFD